MMLSELGEPENPALHCRVALEELSPGGQPRRRQAIKDAELSLGRNERRELMLRLQGTGQSRCFPLRTARLFTRFAAVGRSALRLSPDSDAGLSSGSIQLLLSDCPPDRLRRFLRTVRLKLATAPGPGPAPFRSRLLGPRPQAFYTISPIQPEDLKPVAATATQDTTPVKRPCLQEIRGQTGKASSTKSTVPRHRLQLPSPKPQLSPEQARVLSAVLSGKSIFFTGSAGTGKSYLLKRILGSLPPKGTVVTASTGVAACHIGGTTLHAFAGIGSGKAPLAQCVALAQRPSIRQSWASCQRLVIDEVSMVEASLFDKLEAVARAIRQQDKPFGGIQLIICGDFLQLPPVTKNNQPPQFCFQAKSWRKCIQLTMELTEVWRQTDPTFISLLQAVRLGRCSDEVTQKLKATARHKVERDGILATRLCTHQDDVALTNERRLQQLPGQVHSYEAVDSDPTMVRTLDSQCPVSHLLQLKLGAQVMLVKNLAVSQGLVNGARGVVVGFEADGRGLPTVKFLCGVTEVVRTERWTVHGPGGQLLSRQQLPLRLAWALSIHKSQGMTLDCVEISLARVFESGQAYVALSRARSLQGLRVLDFDPNVVRCDPRVLKFYASLRKQAYLNEDEEDPEQENKDPDI
uniref:ATP-dependent DNA helicase PIF1 n=1 Tax=Monodelphis domestica TaxID=13616 RepID=F7ET02_MONDO